VLDVGRGAARLPLWPAGFCGSITHTDGFAAAVAGKPARIGSVQIGIDAEPITALDRDTCEQVLKNCKRLQLACLPARERGFLETCLFSTKEVIFKAQFPVTQGFVDFHDVARKLV